MSGKPVRAWVLLRLPVPLLVLALLPGGLGGVVGAWLTRQEYAHGFAKWLIVVWQSMLLRGGRLSVFACVAMLGAAGLGALRGRAWGIGALALAAALLGTLRPATWWTVPIGLLLLLANAANIATLRRWGARLGPLVWVPGPEVLLPAPVLAAVGAGPGVVRAAAAAGGLVVAIAWAAVDTSASFWVYEKQVFAPWPDERVDPRVTTIARAPEGVKCDFHDIDVAVDRAVVVAESSLALLSVPRDGGEIARYPLTPWWGPMEGLAMDSETDVMSGDTWFLSGPSTVTAVRWDGGWAKVADSARLPVYLHHAYLYWLRVRDQLVLFSIGTSNSAEDAVMVELDTPAMREPRVRHLRLADGSRVPTIRDAVWVPALGRFVLAPDFGTRLYLAEPGTHVVTPWLEMPTLNGRLTWVGGLDRLFVPLPNQPALWIVEPVSGKVERVFPTQPGVRTVAVDVARGLVLTASVLTGRVLVQRLDDASIVDSFGTLMPMVRNLALFPDKGEALLSTWTALYRIPYATAAR